MSMSRVLHTALIATVLSINATAQAQDKGNFYIGAGLGVVFAGNTRADGVFTSTGSILDGERLGPEPGKTAEGKFDLSPTTSLTFGYDMGKRRYGRFRFEGELFFQKADTSDYQGLLGGVEISPAGSVDTTMSGLVLNALYDIRQFGRVTPYVYLGIGTANAETAYNFQDRGQVTVDGNVQVLQGGFGADIPYDERTTFNLKYRFRRAGLNEAGLDTDIDANIIEFGIRYAL